MKTKLLFLTALFLSLTFSAQQMKEYKFGEPFNISLPANYLKSYDLNDVAVAQFTNAASAKYFVIIMTEKEHLSSVKVAFSDMMEAGEYFGKNILDGLGDDEFAKISTLKTLTINNNPAVEFVVEGTIGDEQTKESTQLFYNATVVETPNAYYQLLSWSSLKDKEKNIEEFRKIAKTFKVAK